MPPIWKKILKFGGRVNPAFAGYSLATGSDTPRALGLRLAQGAATGGAIIGGPVGIALGAGGLAAGSALGHGGGGHGDELDWNTLTGMSDSLKPTGYITPEDIATAEATKTRLRRGVSDTAGQARQMVLRRAAMRGTLGSSALETSLARVEQGEALGNERAGAVGEEQLANMRIGRERFGQQKALTLLGGKLTDMGLARNARTLRHTAFLNSLLSLAQSGLAVYGGAHGGGAGATSGGLMDSPIDEDYLTGDA